MTSVRWIAIPALVATAALALGALEPTASAQPDVVRRWPSERTVAAGAQSLGDPATALQWVNAYRELAGVPDLRLDDRMNKAAQAHAGYYGQNATDQAAFA